MFRQFPNIAEDILMTSEGCRMSWWQAGNLGVILIACYLGLKLDIRCHLLEYFRGELNIIEFLLLVWVKKNKSYGFVSQT